MGPLVTVVEGAHVAEGRATMPLDSYGLLTWANATDACFPPLGRLNICQGFGGERSEGL
jgi:hypothetical protein